MLVAYFCHSPLSQVEYNCALIKVDWLAVCIALFPKALANNLHSPPANGKQGPIPVPEKMVPTDSAVFKKSGIFKLFQRPCLHCGSTSRKNFLIQIQKFRLVFLHILA
jgi:hypothetical protein